MGGSGIKALIMLLKSFILNGKAVAYTQRICFTKILAGKNEKKPFLAIANA